MGSNYEREDPASGRSALQFIGGQPGGIARHQSRQFLVRVPPNNGSVVRGDLFQAYNAKRAVNSAARQRGKLRLITVAKSRPRRGVRGGVREFQEGSVNLIESNGYCRGEVKATES